MALHHFKLIVLALLISAGSVFSQDKLSAKDKIKVQEANSAFINGYYDDALSLYRNILSENKDNSFLHYRIGFCQVELNQLDEAVEHFELVKVNQLKGKHLDYYFAYGSALQQQGKYQTALEKYKLFEKNGRKKDLEYHEVSRFIKQCEYAITAVQSPVSVQINSVGGFVNSPYDDFHPMVTLDGKKMVFTSRRSSKKNIDLLPDNQYYENVYSSNWDETKEMWGEAILLDGRINSKEYDANTGISSDGKQLLVYKNVDELNGKVFGSVGSGDIFISKLGKNDQWGKPKLLEGINSEYYDGGACFSADGTKIFFISDREGMLHRGSVGGKDIWMSELQEDKTWGKPVNLGEVVNSTNNEISVYVHPNGKTLFFASEGHDEMNFGGYDIFKTELINGVWSKPVNLGFPINTANDEKEFFLSVDGLTGWISKTQDAKNKVDIFQVDLNFYNVITGQNDPFSIVKGNVSDANTGLFFSTAVTFTDKATGEKTKVISDENGEYTAPLVSNKTYTVSIQKEGYNAFSKELVVNLPPPTKQSKRRKRLKRGEVEKSITTAEVHSINYNIQISRTVPLKIVSKDLFNTKTLRFKETEEGYVLDSFSEGILALYVQQSIAESAVTLHLTAHYDDESDDDEVSLGKSNNLAKIILDYLKANNVDMSKVQWFAMGNTQPMADTETSEGRKLNRRVEIKIQL